jgi:hypothetical protein
VDLTAVTHAAKEAGLALVGATRQTRLLQRLGADALARAIREAGLSRVEERAHLAALSLLTDPHELGRLAVLAFGRNAPDRPLTGFGDRSPLLPDVAPDLLQLRSAPTVILRSAAGLAGRGTRDD